MFGIDIVSSNLSFYRFRPGGRVGSPILPKAPSIFPGNNTYCKYLQINVREYRRGNQKWTK